MHAIRPFPWATATAAEISRHLGLGNLPIDLIDLVLPRLRRLVEENEGPIPSSYDLLAETNELLPAAWRAGPFAQMAQTELPPLME